ncbi:hypothetical protein [Sphingomonas sp. RS2018]
MRPFSTHVAPIALAVALIALPYASAMAQVTRTDAAPLPAAVVSPAVPFGEGAVADDALGAIAGREDTNQLSVANLNAGVSRNSVGDNSTTGDARISDNALQNLSGLSILNVNTGNNVAINAAMNVNISIAPQQ